MLLLEQHRPLDPHLASHHVDFYFVWVVGILLLADNRLRSLVAGTVLRTLAMCGRHSLAIFAMGCMFALLGRIAFHVGGSPLAMQLIVKSARFWCDADSGRLPRVAREGKQAQVADDIARDVARAAKWPGRRRRTMVVIVMKLEIYVARYETLEFFIGQELTSEAQAYLPAEADFDALYGPPMGFALARQRTSSAQPILN